MKTSDVARIARLLTFNYSVFQSCEDMGLSEQDFWETMATDIAVNNAISVAYCMGRDDANLDRQLPIDYSVRAFERGQQDALDAFKRERADILELKGDLIERIIQEKEAEDVGKGEAS
jgi:hypothetical protein